MLPRTRPTNNQPASNPWIAWLLAFGVFFGIHPQLPAYSGSTDRDETAFTADIEGGVTWGESLEWEGGSVESELEFDSEGDETRKDSDSKSSDVRPFSCEPHRNQLYHNLSAQRTCSARGPKGYFFSSNHRYLPHGRLNI